MQSAFVVHAATHAPAPEALGAQAMPLGQSAFVMQPHPDIEPGPGPGLGCALWQTLPPAPLVQSALVVQPHVPKLHTEPFPLPAQSALEVQPHVLHVALQAPPQGFLAQSALVTQPTHRPVVVLQAGLPALPVQSALEAHARMHAPIEPPTNPGLLVVHTKPAGQSAFDEQPHAGGPEQPPAPIPSHM